jgi:hypothetical protein
LWLLSISLLKFSKKVEILSQKYLKDPKFHSFILNSSYTSDKSISSSKQDDYLDRTAVEKVVLNIFLLAWTTTKTKHSKKWNYQLSSEKLMSIQWAMSNKKSSNSSHAEI